jgi:ribonuclease P protein component
LIWRIRERGAFERLAREGRRTRAGVLWCTYLHDPAMQPPRVAYSIGRATGSAVLRNQLRRRLRAVLQHLELTPGMYLIGVRPGAERSSSVELEFDLRRMLDVPAG